MKQGMINLNPKLDEQDLRRREIEIEADNTVRKDFIN
jgi:hypothetical protein